MTTPKGVGMNRDTVVGNWNKFKGNLQVRWCRLIGDPLGVISGKRTQSTGERQLSYCALRSSTLRGILRTHSSGGSYSARTVENINRTPQAVRSSTSARKSL